MKKITSTILACILILTFFTATFSTSVWAATEETSVSDTSQKPINKCYVNVTSNSYIYDGKEKQISIVVKDGKETLTENNDYTYVIKDNENSENIVKDAGLYEIYVYGQGNYGGQVIRRITISPRNINECSIQKEYEYNGGAGEYVPIIKFAPDNDTELDLKINKDFSSRRTGGGPPFFKEDIDLGPALYKYTVTGQGNYCGEVEASIKVVEAKISASDITVTPSTKSGVVDPKTGKIFNTVSVKVKYLDKTYYLENGSDFTVEYFDVNSKEQTLQVSIHKTFKGKSDKITVPYTEPTFVWGRDDFQFTNGGNSSGINYSINDDTLQKMTEKFKLTDDEIDRIKSHVASNNKGEMKGRCNGMATATILSKMGFMKFSDVDPSFSDIAHDNIENDKILSYINFLHAGITLDGRYLESKAGFIDSDTTVQARQGDYIKEIIKELEEGTWIKLFYENHAVVAYGIEPFEYHSNETGLDYNYRISIYDSNILLNEEKLYQENYIYVYNPHSMFGCDYRYESNSGAYWHDYTTNWSGIWDAFKFLSLTEEEDILIDEAIIFGDANFDGSVDIRDVTYIQKYLAELVSINSKLQRINADANHDGKITINDATYLSMKLAGFDV